MPKDTKKIFVICGIVLLGFLLFDIFSLFGGDCLTYIYLIFVVLLFLIQIIIRLIILIKNYKSINLQSFLPLIVIFITSLIMAIILCITPGTIPSHRIGLYFYSRELFTCPLPPDSEIILEGSEHGNGSGSSKHCENLAYMAISSNKSLEEIKNFYESKLLNKIDKESLNIKLLNKAIDDSPIGDFMIFSFTGEQINQLERVAGKRKAIYLISAVKVCTPTCLDGR